MADPEITAALQYFNEVRTQQIIESIVLEPSPPLPTTAEVIAARSWANDADRPPLTSDEIQAALDIIERATERSLYKRVPIEGGSPGGAGRGGPGGTGGVSTGRGPGQFNPPGSFGGVASGPSSQDIVIEFMNWALGPAGSPEPAPQLQPEAKLAAINSLLAQRTPFQPGYPRLRELQAWYLWQVKALRSQGL